MARRHRIALIVVAAAFAASAPAGVQAQKDVASCKPVLDAVSKQMTTPYHMYTTLPSFRPGDKPNQSEMISTGGQHYILLDGHWKKSPMDQAAMVKQEQDNIRDATAMSCRRLPDESVGGVSASVYTMHSENQDTKSDGKVWLSKSTGLILQSDVDLGSDSDSKSHMSSRYEYTNVQRPAGVE